MSSCKLFVWLLVTATKSLANIQTQVYIVFHSFIFTVCLSHLTIGYISCKKHSALSFESSFLILIFTTCTCVLCMLHLCGDQRSVVGVLSVFPPGGFPRFLSGHLPFIKCLLLSNLAKPQLASEIDHWSITWHSLEQPGIPCLAWGIV